jgi:hypothetical protein
MSSIPSFSLRWSMASRTSATASRICGQAPSRWATPTESAYRRKFTVVPSRSNEKTSWAYEPPPASARSSLHSALHGKPKRAVRHHNRPEHRRPTPATALVRCRSNRELERRLGPHLGPVGADREQYNHGERCHVLWTLSQVPQFPRVRLTTLGFSGGSDAPVRCKPGVDGCAALYAFATTSAFPRERRSGLRHHRPTPWSSLGWWSSLLTEMRQNRPGVTRACRGPGAGGSS